MLQKCNFGSMRFPSTTVPHLVDRVTQKSFARNTKWVRRVLRHRIWDSMRRAVVFRILISQMYFIHLFLLLLFSMSTAVILIGETVCDEFFSECVLSMHFQQSHSIECKRRKATSARRNDSRKIIFVFTAASGINATSITLAKRTNRIY